MKTQKVGPTTTGAALVVEQQPRATPDPAADPYKRNRTTALNRTLPNAAILGKSSASSDLERSGTLVQTSELGTVIRHGTREELRGSPPNELGASGSFGAGGLRATAKEATVADLLLQAQYGRSGAVEQASSARAATGLDQARSEPGILTQHLNAIAAVPVTRVPKVPPLGTGVPNRTEVAVDPDGEAVPAAVPHGRQLWDPDHPSTAPFIAGYNQGHDAGILARGGAGTVSVLPNEPNMEHGQESPRCCCLKDSIDPRPLSDERALLAKLGPYLLWELSPAWRVPLWSCEDVSCCIWSTLCPCCSACYMRSKVLEGRHDRYLCCQGMASKGLDDCICGCPLLCMTIESFLCCPCTVASNRKFYAQKHRLRRDAWDNRIERCNNIMHYGYCCSGTPLTENERDEMNRRVNASGNTLNCAALLCYLPFLSCMMMQLHRQIRDGPRKNPYEPPKPLEKRPPVRLPIRRIHDEDDAEFRRTGRRMRKKREQTLKELAQQINDLEVAPNEPRMMWWGDQEIDSDADVNTYVDAEAASRMNGGGVVQKRRRRRLRKIITSRTARSNKIHPLHPLAPHVGDPDEQQKLRACPTPQSDSAADIRDVHARWSTAMIQRARWAWGEPSDADDDEVLEMEQFLTRSAPNMTQGNGGPAGFAKDTLSLSAAMDRASTPKDIEDYELMKTLASAKRHGEKLLTGEDAPLSAGVEESLSHMEGTSYSSARKTPLGSRSSPAASTWQTVKLDASGTSVRGMAGATVESDDSIDFANMSHGMPKPWFDDSDNSSDENGGQWGSPKKEQTSPNKRRAKRPKGRKLGDRETAQDEPEKAGRTLSRLSPAASTPSPARPPKDPGLAEPDPQRVPEDLPPWQSQSLKRQRRVGEQSDRGLFTTGTAKAMDTRKQSLSRTATPYKRRERQGMTSASKQAILKNSTVSFRETIPALANSSSLAVESRKVVHVGQQEDAVVWQEYRTSAPLAI